MLGSVGRVNVSLLHKWYKLSSIFLLLSVSSEINKFIAYCWLECEPVENCFHCVVSGDRVGIARWQRDLSFVLDQWFFSLKWHWGAQRVPPNRPTRLFDVFFFSINHLAQFSETSEREQMDNNALKKKRFHRFSFNKCQWERQFSLGLSIVTQCRLWFLTSWRNRLFTLLPGDVCKIDSLCTVYSHENIYEVSVNRSISCFEPCDPVQC